MPNCNDPSKFSDRQVYANSVDPDWAWRPSWSCDPHAAKKISFPLPKEAPHKIGFDRPSGFSEEDV